MEEISKYLIVHAINENCCEMGPGDWESRTWEIYSDGFYCVKTCYIPKKINFKNQEARITKQKKGKLNGHQLTIILQIMKEKWIDPSFNSYAFDGDRWRIRQFYPSGRVKNSTGRISKYIYGQPIEQLTEELYKLL